MSAIFQETKPGGCYLEDVSLDTLITCRYEATGCGAYTYRSFQEIEDSKTTNKCRLNHRSWAGMCLDEKLCTSDPSNCASGDSQYVPESPFCNIEYNRYVDSPAGPFHLTGSCDVDGQETCVFSERACTAVGGTFSTPSQNGYADTCTCDNVKVGGCRRSDGSYMCAVSAAGCGSGDTYVEWNDSGLTAAVDCRLCADFPKTTRTWQEDLGRVYPLDYDRMPTKPSPGMSEDNLKMVAIGVGVGLVVMVVASFMCGRCSKRGKAAKEFDSQQSNGNHV